MHSTKAEREEGVNHNKKKQTKKSF